MAVLLLVLFALSVSGAFADLPAICDTPAGHFFVLAPNNDCSVVYATHGEEFECPHQIDVQLLFRFKALADRQAFCQSWRQLNGNRPQAAVQYLVIFNTGENGLVHLADGTADYHADLQIVWDNFVGTNWTVLRSNVELELVRPLYFRVLNQVPASSKLTYLLYADRSDSQATFWLKHYVTNPPAFDHSVRVEVLGAHPERFARLNQPRLVYFNGLDVPGNRLMANGNTIHGSVLLENSAGIPFLADVAFRVAQDIYFGISDNFVVLDEYCHFKDRFKWYLCPASYPN